MSRIWAPFDTDTSAIALTSSAVIPTESLTMVASGLSTTMYCPFIGSPATATSAVFTVSECSVLAPPTLKVFSPDDDNDEDDDTDVVDVGDDDVGDDDVGDDDVGDDDVGDDDVGDDDVGDDDVGDDDVGE